MSEEAWALQYRDKQMYQWTLPSTFGREAKVAHWAAFIVLALCTLYLAIHAWNAKGPGGKAKYFYGYKEEMMISIYVNLFACVAYYGKVVADSYGHHYENSGPVIPVMGNYAYMDYITTCPLLVYDLLGQLRAPYKTTCSILIFLVLLCGVVTNFYEGERFQGPAYAWFGLGVVLFTMDYFLLYKIISQQYTKLETLSYQSHAKKALFPLKMAIGTFFVVWVAFPIIWILSDRGLGLIGHDAVEVLHALCDIVAKSVYGFMLARFRTYFDKKLFAMLEDLGLDGEEEMEHLDKELAHDHVESKEEKLHHAPIASPLDAKMHASLVRDPIDTSGDLVHAMGGAGGRHDSIHGGHGGAPPAFSLTPRGEVKYTPRDNHYDMAAREGSHGDASQLNPRHSPRRRSVVGMIANGSFNANEWQRRKSDEHEPMSVSQTTPLMKIHNPARQDERLLQIQKQMELINRELALASGGSDGHREARDEKHHRPHLQAQIPSMYGEHDDYEAERRRRKREKKARSAGKYESPFTDDEDEKGVC